MRTSAHYPSSILFDQSFVCNQSYVGLVIFFPTYLLLSYLPSFLPTSLHMGFCILSLATPIQEHLYTLEFCFPMPAPHPPAPTIRLGFNFPFQTTFCRDYFIILQMLWYPALGHPYLSSSTSMDSRFALPHQVSFRTELFRKRKGNGRTCSCFQIPTLFPAWETKRPAESSTIGR